MVFSGIPFLFFFLPVFLILYFITPDKFKNAVILVFSLVFYAWGEPVYIVLMLLSSFVDYVDGLLLEKFAEHKVLRRISFVTALVINISILCFFKYAGLAVETVNALLHLKLKVPDIALPIGISFYTFQTVSYSIDVYRKEVKAEKNYFSYLTYVSMFPQLIAGPIVRFSNVQERLHERKISERAFVHGFKRFLMGLFRKVLIANQIGELWDIIRSAESRSVAASWLGILCFTLQLYYDFSAYSDMAIGLGEVLGFEFPENFIYPLSATSITDFWRRWHISLSGWFRDYVYIPLGGNRKGVLKHLRNMFAVWFLTGLWHGASWNYVLWGLYHGLLLTLEKYLWGKKLEKAPSFFKHLYTLVIVVVGFGIFTFEDLGELAAYFPGLVGIGNSAAAASDTLWYLGNYLPVFLTALVFAFPLWLKIVKKLEEGNAYRKRLAGICEVLLAAGLFLLTMAALVKDVYNPFLYFRF
ncbi:MAG: MBOAT family protein [Lachnospiraceae bacterium]|nr:MBOAT family protein [Lachnospiraceae bacterium]